MRQKVKNCCALRVYSLVLYAGLRIIGTAIKFLYLSYVDEQFCVSEAEGFLLFQRFDEEV